MRGEECELGWVRGEMCDSSLYAYILKVIVAEAHEGVEVDLVLLKYL